MSLPVAEDGARDSGMTADSAGIPDGGAAQTRPSPYDALRLENQLCFPLYACSREIIKRYKPHLEPLGLTYTQYLTMLILWERGQVTVKELGRRLFLDSGTLTPLLKKLEGRGLVERRRDPSDERSLLVSITAAGEALREAAVRVPPLMAQSLTLTPEEARELYRLLYKLLR